MMEVGKIITAPKVNIELRNGTILKEVYIFKDKSLGDSIVESKFDITDILMGTTNEVGIKTIYFSSDFVQGGISCYVQIKNWNFVD